MKTINMTSGYMAAAWDIDSVIENARKELDGVKFDTVVGTGLSGAIVVPQLARELGVNALLVRKPNDGSHSWLPVEGVLGHRWLFVDDFIDTGATRRRVRDTIDAQVKRHNDARYAPEHNPAFHTTYAGSFLYNRALKGSNRLALRF